MEPLTVPLTAEEEADIKALGVFHRSLTLEVLALAQRSRERFYRRYGWWPVCDVTVGTSGSGRDTAKMGDTPEKPRKTILTHGASVV